MGAPHPHTRTPTEIVSHMGDLYGWALSIAQGKEQWREAKLGEWNVAVDGFSLP